MTLNGSTTFSTLAKSLIDDAEAGVRLGLRKPTLLRDYRQRNACYCEPLLGKIKVKDIDNRKLREFVNTLAEKKIKPTTILPIMSFVSQVLVLAADEGCIRSVPRIPRPRQKDCPRPAFTQGQYAHLLSTLKRIERAQPPVRFKASVVDAELRWMVTFMANAFLRPGDLFTLQHRHVEVVENDGSRYLRLNPPASKNHHGPIITMPAAVAIYQRAKAASTKKGFGKPDDYVFLPDRANRSYAKEIASRQFVEALKVAGLRTDAGGNNFTLYSIRHYAITTRIRNSENLDLLVLARNCRTSVEMIDRFYASTLTAEMKVESLQSFKRPSRYSMVEL